MSVCSSGRVLSSRPVGGSSSPQKTILLVQAVSKPSSSLSPSTAVAAGTGIQSLLLPSSVRSMATVATGNPSRLNSNMSMSKLSTDSLTVTPARLGVRVVSVPSSSSVAASGLSPGQSHVDVQTPYGLVFNSRTIQADGTVITSKEYLCNFCQFKVSSVIALLEHSSTHLFSCNHCPFRSTSRLESLLHKRDSHPSAADEVAGFEDLDHPTLVVKTARVPRLVGAAFLPPPSSTGARLGGASSLVTHQHRTPGMSLLNTMSSSTRPVSSSACVVSSSSSVVRTVSGKTGDSYFTYRIAHDTDGRVQAYECDICGYRSVHINEMFAHASTHSLADLAKSGAASINNVVWECFYCAFSAPLQASVVSHVIASHPNQPIQLKRLPTTHAAASGGEITTEPSTSSSKTTSSSAPDLPPLSVHQPSSDKTTPAAVSAADGSRSAKPLDVKIEKKKKSDGAGDEGCIWGCYYCTMQSASRNDIITHLKKQHSSEKLVVTRRRITHVVTSSGGGGSHGNRTPASVATSHAGGDVTKPPTSQAAETSLTPGPEVGNVGSSGGTRTDDGDHCDKTGASGKSRKRQMSLSLSSDHQQPVTSSLMSSDNGDGSDGSLAAGGAAAAKSRRKQVAPRRVADELPGAATDKLTSSDDASLTAGDSIKSVAATSDPLPAVTSPAMVTGSSRNLLAPSSGPRRPGRTSMSKYDSLIKKLKMAESEESGMEMGGLLDKPHVEEPAKMSPSTRSSQGKALSLLTGQLVSGYVQPPNGMPTLSSPPLPVLNCESNPAKSGLKVNVVQYVEVRPVDRSQCYVYDAERLTARCGVCGTSAHGSDVLTEIREHVAAHFNECRWACAYCAFQCNRRTMVVLHVTQRHRGQPLRIVRRQPYRANNNKTENDSSLNQLQQLTDKSTEVAARRRLRGPRCRRDALHMSMTGIMWQCAFCSRRSLFRGLIVIHMNLAHFDHNSELAVPQRWIRSPVGTDITSQDVGMKRGEVHLVRIEDVDQYPTLSDVILSNGANLIHELDVDDVAGETVSVADGSSDTAEFRCLHCHFRGLTAVVVKSHILQNHRLEDVTVLDLRPSRRPSHEHLLMCRSVECQFVSSVEKDFRAHIDTHPSHATNNVAALPPRGEPKSRDQPRQMPVLSKNTNKRLLSADAVPVSSARLVAAGGAKSRRGTDGPIEYNDDGTLRGLDLGTRAVNIKIQCTHCCMLMSGDVGDVRSHLTSAHPRLVPLAIDMECTDPSLPTSLFFCVVADCDFVTSYYNVYKHHMDEEHPDSESGIRARHYRTSSATKQHLAPSIHRASKQDRSFAVSIRRSKKPPSVLNSSADNGHYSPSTSFDDAAFLPTADDIDTPPMPRKSSSHSTQYSSQDFDFSRRYKCILCSLTAATLAEMKSHLTERHGSTTAHQCIDRRARQLRKRQGIYFCPDPNCAFCCKFDDELAVHVEREHPSLVGITGTPLSKSSQNEEGGCAGDRVYQCAHCTYITTDLRNVRVHVVAEHATTEGGFAEIKTAVSSDGSLIMNVNDAVVPSSSPAGDRSLMLENGDSLAVSNVKVDDEGKVFAVL